MSFPNTPLTLLSKLKHSEDGPQWQIAWERFHELYHSSIRAVAHACYRHHTGGQEPSGSFVEDAVADTIDEFFFRGHVRYDATKGRLRSYLRIMTNARVVDRLRKERPIDHVELDDSVHALLPDESCDEGEVFRSTVLKFLLNDVRACCSPKQFEVFERVKLKFQSPADVAEELRITRAAVDRHVHDVRVKLSKLARQKDYQEEYYG